VTAETADALSWVSRLLGVALLVNTLERCASLALLTRTGILSGPNVIDFLGMQPGAPLLTTLARVLSPGWVVVGLLSLRTIASGALLVVPVAAPGWRLTVLTAAALELALIARIPLGRDGSEQMNAVSLAGLAGACLDLDGWGPQLGLGFIGAQLLLAYWVAGIAKLGGAPWRTGDAVGRILVTNTFGYPPLGRFLLRHPPLNRVAGWSVIVAELAFPVLIFLEGWPGVAALAGGIAFHAAGAVFMGLNGFLLSFVAAYPAVWWLARSW
jgi:hypothetical protein